MRAISRLAGRRGWPTLLLCLATALVTWSATTMASSLAADPGSNNLGVSSSAAPPMASESAPAGRQHGASGSEHSLVDGSRTRTRPVPATGAVQAPVTVENRRATAIRIPALNIDQGVVELAVNGDSLQVPDDYFDIGWWRDGPAPGEKGAAVMVGHVDSPTGPAVFYGLSGLVSGQRIVVGLDDGSRAVFQVSQTVLYDRDEIPSDRVYRSHGRPGLNLLTCGGSYDHTAGAYSGNVVVYTDLVQRIPPPPIKKATEHAAKADGGVKTSQQTGRPWTRERVLGQPTERGAR